MTNEMHSVLFAALNTKHSCGICAVEFDMDELNYHTAGKPGLCDRCQEVQIAREMSWQAYEKKRAMAAAAASGGSILWLLVVIFLFTAFNGGSALPYGEAARSLCTWSSALWSGGVLP